MGTKRPRAGSLRHLVYVESHTTGLDSYGQQASSSTGWTRGAGLRCFIEPLSGEEGDIARRRFPEASHRVVLDYNTTLASTGATAKRLAFGSRNFHIFEIRNLEEESFQMELTVGEKR